MAKLLPASRLEYSPMDPAVMVVLELLRALKFCPMEPPAMVMVEPGLA
jgi:hypothetical protein